MLWMLHVWYVYRDTVCVSCKLLTHRAVLLGTTGLSEFILLPPFYRIVRFVTLCDFGLVVWLLIAATPQAQW